MSPSDAAPGPAGTQGDAPLLVAEGLTKSYPGAEAPALRGVDLTLGRGEFVAVVGPSGCGKTTLLFVLGLMMRPSAGRLRLDGRDVASLSEPQLVGIRRRRIGFVFQRFNLIPVLSALDNVLMPLRLRGSPDDGSAAKLLEEVGLGGKLHRRPHQLSIGEQQRVAIARALAGDPDLLLADEPTGNLDTETSDRVLELLTRFHRSRGLSIVMITHNPAAAAVAGRTIRMRDGKIAEGMQKSE
jgi:putative ABC transport system ATP-binding protein